VVVTVGLAVTLAPVVALNPVAGLHAYVLAPVAVRVIEPPGQIVAEFTVTIGKGFTVTTEVTVPVHPPELPEIV
jgi:hypothetical protein